MYRAFIILTSLLFAMTIPSTGYAGTDLPGCELTAVAASPVGAVIGPNVRIVADFDQTGTSCHSNVTCTLLVDGVDVPNGCTFPGSCDTDTYTGAFNACHSSIVADVWLQRGTHTVVAQMTVPGTTPGTGAIAWTILVQ